MHSIQHQASLRGTLIPNFYTDTKIDAPNMVTLLIWRDFNVQPRNSNAKLAISLAISQAFAIRRINRNRIPTSLGSQRPINFQQVLSMCKTISLAVNQKIIVQMTLFAFN